MFYVYILYSESKHRYYVGHTQEIKERLNRHNEGRERYTKSGIPWKLIHQETFETRGKAMIKEKKIKGRGACRYLASIKG